MKKILLSAFLVLFVIAASAQVDSPVKWKFELSRISDLSYELRMTAITDHPWHIYSQADSAGKYSSDQYFPTSIVFTKNPLVVLQNKPREEGELIQKMENTLGIELKYYTQKVCFVQVFKLKKNTKTNLSGSIEYMACTDSQCLPPETRRFNIIVQ